MSHQSLRKPATSDRRGCIIFIVLIFLICGEAYVSRDTQSAHARSLGETSCQVDQPHTSPEKAQLGHQRRRNATIVLSTHITAGQGLTNQHINLVTLITVGLAAGVDKLVLPKYKHRSHFSLGVSWQEGSADHLWDTQSIKEFVQARGVQIQAEPLKGFEDVDLSCSWYHKSLDIADVAHVVQQNVMSTLAQAEDSNTEPKLHVKIHNFDFGLNVQNSRLFRETLLAIKFSSTVQDMASRVLRKVQNGGKPYNGLHLRMEDDIADAVQGEGGFDAAKAQYEAAFRQLNFKKSVPLYVATGLFSDKASGRRSDLTMKALEWVREGVKEEFASVILSKEDALSEEELLHLSSEQRAAVDVIVLKDSSAFVGLSLSTMSFLVQELRAVLGQSRNTNVMVGNPVNEVLFSKTMQLKDKE